MKSSGSKSGRNLETAVCAWRGHEIPGAGAVSLDGGSLLLGVEMDEAHMGRPWRLVRCLRCDSWVPADRPDPAVAAPPPRPEDLHLPRRGKELRQAVILRFIAVERGVHSLLFTVVAVLAVALRSELAGVKSWVRHVLATMTRATGNTNALSGDYLIREGNHLLALRTSTLNVVIAAAIAYAVVEGVEAVGLWRERRWAEYLTVVATAGFLPYEIIELTKGVSVLKVAALVLNLAVLVYLVWAKRLFGVARIRDRRGPAPPNATDLYGRPGLAADAAS